MKKLLSAFLILIMVLGLVACGTNSIEDPSSKNEPSNSTATQQQPENNDVSSTEKNTDEKNYAYISASKYYIDYSTTRRKAEKNTSVVLYGSGEDAIQLIWFDDGKDFTGNEMDIIKSIDYLSVTYDVDRYINSDFSSSNKDYSINVEDGNSVTINGIGMYKFKGYITDAKDQKCIAYGYSFVISGSPCVLLGYGTDDSALSQLTKEVDNIANSIRFDR